MCKFIMFVKGGGKKTLQRHLKGNFSNAHSRWPEEKSVLMRQKKAHYKDRMSLWNEVQQDEPTPALIDNLHKLLMPEDATQLEAMQQFWQIKHTLHVSHPNMTASITNSQAVFVMHREPLLHPHSICARLRVAITLLWFIQYR